MVTIQINFGSKNSGTGLLLHGVDERALILLVVARA